MIDNVEVHLSDLKIQNQHRAGDGTVLVESLLSMQEPWAWSVAAQKLIAVHKPVTPRL